MPINSQPQITTSSSSVNDGFTKSLSLNCSFQHPHSTEFSVIYSLILSKTQTTEDTIYNEIAMATSISPNNVSVQNSLGAQVTGHLSQSDISHIQYMWQYPSSQVSGKYLCRAHGMDHLGHPVTVATEASIAEKEVDLEMILDQMKQMQMTQDKLKSQLNDTQKHLINTTAQLVKVQSEQNITHAQLNQLTHELDQTKSEHNKTELVLELAMAKLENVTNQQSKTMLEKMALFELLTLGNITKASMAEHISKPYLGHEYLLSKLSKNKVSVDVMELECQFVGGYLAEISDQAEFDFVENFLNSVTYDGIYVNVGAHDRGHEATWNYIHSGGKVSFFNWIPDEPNNSGGLENCIVLTKYKGAVAMNDLRCEHENERFLCEIPI